MNDGKIFGADVDYYGGYAYSTRLEDANKFRTLDSAVAKATIEEKHWARQSPEDTTVYKFEVFKRK